MVECDDQHPLQKRKIHTGLASSEAGSAPAAGSAPSLGKKKKHVSKETAGREAKLPESPLLSWPPCRDEKRRKPTKKRKSYRSCDLLNLRSLRSRSRRLGNWDSLDRLDLLNGGRGGNSFSGRHYNNRDKGELNE
jgi:hypothetical protein